jgi:hypothetical protein
MNNDNINWYYVSFETIKTKTGEEIFPDGEYFCAKNDNGAINVAEAIASEGVDYRDAGHFDLTMLSVTRVDPEREYEEIETIYY